MRVIPVLDLLGGRAVRARAGDRDSYAPLSSPLAPDRPGDALALARAYRSTLGFDELYLADLDAIMLGAPQRSLRRELAAESPGVRAWVDAGVASAEQARDVLADGASRVIVGLETLPVTAPEAASPLAGSGAAASLTGSGTDSPTRSRASSLLTSRALLESLVAAVGPSRAAFSLDLRNGVPVTRAPDLAAFPPIAIAELAAAAGFRAFIVLDLARVGTGSGLDLPLILQLRRALPSPSLELLAGGGLRTPSDLLRLSDTGADGALVGARLQEALKV